MRTILTLAAAAILAASAAIAAPLLAATPLSRMDLPWWRMRFEAKQAELHRGPVDLVFYGDSITQDWEHDGPQPWNQFHAVWQRFYGDRHAIELGFKGDATSHLLWRIEHGEAEGISPKVAVVLIGANNFGRVHWDAEQTLAGIDAVVAAIQQHLPRTHIVLLGVLPSERSAWVTQNTDAVNAMMARRYAGNPVVTYLDLGRVLMRDGRPDPSLYLDPMLTPPDPLLHPNAEGQARLAAAMEPTLAPLLGDHVHR